jgi:gliding motility-associated-like protein
MKPYLSTFLVAFVALLLKHEYLHAQIKNPCGVVAQILPANKDSVVTANTTINFTSNSINADTVYWLYDRLYQGVTGPSWNYGITPGVHTISLVARKGQCADTTTVVYFAAGTAQNRDSFASLQYGFYETNEEATCVDNTRDSGLVMGGVSYLWRTCGEQGVVVKTTEKGCIEWSKKFEVPYYCNNSKVTAIAATADNNYYVVTNNAELARLDKKGNLVWNKRLNQSQQIAGISFITSDPQSFIYTLYITPDFGWILTKLDSNGTIVWNKYCSLSYNFMNDQGQFDYASPSGLLWLNGNIYVCGNAHLRRDQSYFAFITKMDALTGKLQWQYGYTDLANPTTIAFAHMAAYGNLLMCSSFANGHMVSLISQQGDIVKNIGVQFPLTYSQKVSKAYADKKGRIYMMQWTEEALNLQPYFWYATNFAVVDTSLNKYGGMVLAEYQRSYFVDATMAANNKFAAVGEQFGYVDNGVFSSRDFRLLKMDTIVSSPENCFSIENNYVVSKRNLDRIDFKYEIDSSLTLEAGDASAYTVTDAFVQSRFTCPDFLDSCSYMKITGPASICSLKDVYTYRVHRNRKCGLIPQWVLPSGVQMINNTDTVVTLKFNSPGIYHIAAILNSCIPVKDSLIIEVAPKLAKLNLGNDTIICSGTTIQLHAGSEFLTYQWNKGSTDSVLTVTQPGVYWLEAADSCSNKTRDSVRINPFNLAIDLGPDRTMCYNDTIQLKAPGGFLNYQWSDNYFIDFPNQPDVVVNPPKDTAYYLQAEKLPGCFAFDTVHIKVNRMPPLQLGNDISLCAGDSALISAPAGFISYLWSNGSTSAAIIIKHEGQYIVTAKTAEGCKTSDTLSIVKVWTKPLITLDHNTSLCMGTTRRLEPGNFVSYLWHDGSTNSSFDVDNTGVFFVTVKDDHNCINTDTVRILNLLPAPASFLPPDTAICSYGRSVLSVSNHYSRYLWSTGEMTASITVDKPGNYWLQVSDKFSCIGTDTVSISLKDCMEGFYIPTAFSPNRDGKNDIFKPLIFGNLVSFEWIVYNRFGEKVFTSSLPENGWDGMYKGTVQGVGAYTWQCRFRIAGQQQQTKSGTVMLIR